MATAENVRQCRDIVLSDSERTFVVVSAPGKRFLTDQKVTDILIDRLGVISNELGLGMYDYIISRGEYLMAQMFAQVVGFEFLDAGNYIVIKQNGECDLVATKKNFDTLDRNKKYVMGGFFGVKRAAACNRAERKCGDIQTFARGGSDTTGAVVAACMGADLYEIFTDTYGVYDGNCETIKCLTHAEFGRLGLRKVLNGVPIKIDNTFDPGVRYTMVK